ncbi:MAG: ABC transporter ATP-binding protein [Spirochaetaceae bacterium]|nr:MAG: ABC transporter ATP-binding protein [Spirochaetaceae bacterium]
MSKLRIENVVSGYGGMDVLHKLSLEVQEGKIVTLLGPNGSGKTTVLRTIFGILAPKEGKVFYKGEDITALPPEKVARLGMSYVPQEENIFAALTVQENLEMGAFTREDDIRPRMEEVFELFPDLTDRRKSRAGDLSGGMRQMLAIGRALMLNPEMLLLDEPSTGLAPFLVEQIFERIQTLNKQGVTVFLVEQNAQALRCADRAYILEGGEKRAEGTAQELMNDEEIGKHYLGR